MKTSLILLMLPLSVFCQIQRGPSGVTINSPFTVAGAATFKDGVIATNAALVNPLISLGVSNIVFRASTLGGTNGVYFINPTSGNTNWILLQ